MGTHDWETGAHSHAANNLILTADNEGKLYPLKLRILGEVKRRIEAGTYDPGKSPSYWMPFVKAAAQGYRIDFGFTEARELLKPSVQKDAAAVIAVREYGRILHGEAECGPVRAHSPGGHDYVVFSRSKTNPRAVRKIDSGLTRRVLRAFSPSGLAVGRSVFTPHLKIHHYRGSLLLTDLTHAGKRGKKVSELHVGTSTHNDEVADRILSALAEDLLPMTYAQARAHLQKFQEGGVWAPTKGLKLRLDERFHRGIDVEPAGTTIHLEHKYPSGHSDDNQVVEIESSLHDFLVTHHTSDVRDPDYLRRAGSKHNQTTGYWPSGSEAQKKKAAGVFYAWLQKNMQAASRMTMRDLVGVWDRLGVRYHSH